MGDELLRRERYQAPDFYSQEKKQAAEDRLARFDASTLADKRIFDDRQQMLRYTLDEEINVAVNEKFAAMRTRELEKIQRNVFITRSNKEAKQQKVETKYADEAFRTKVREKIRAPYRAIDETVIAKNIALREEHDQAETNVSRLMAIKQTTLLDHPQIERLIGDRDFVTTLPPGETQETVAHNHLMANKHLSTNQKDQDDYINDLSIRMTQIDLSKFKFRNKDEEKRNYSYIAEWGQFAKCACDILNHATPPMGEVRLEMFNRAKMVALYLNMFTSTYNETFVMRVDNANAMLDKEAREKMREKSGYNGLKSRVAEYAKERGMIPGVTGFEDMCKQSTDITTELDKMRAVGKLDTQEVLDLFNNHCLGQRSVQVIESVLEKYYLGQPLSQDKDSLYNYVANLVIKHAQNMSDSFLLKLMKQFTHNGSKDLVLLRKCMQIRRDEREDSSLTMMQVSTDQEALIPFKYSRTGMTWGKPVRADAQGNILDPQSQQNAQYNENMKAAFVNAHINPDGVAPYANDFADHALQLNLKKDDISLENIRKNPARYHEISKMLTRLSDFFTNGLERFLPAQKKEALEKLAELCAYGNQSIQDGFGELGIGIREPFFGTFQHESSKGFFENELKIFHSQYDEVYGAQ